MRARYEDHKPFVIFGRKILAHFTPAARTAAAALSALAVLLAPTTAHAAPADHLPRHAPGDTITLPVRDALQALIVQDESRAGYERSPSDSASTSISAYRTLRPLAETDRDCWASTTNWTTAPAGRTDRDAMPSSPSASQMRRNWWPTWTPDTS
ncbi:hypothetical protein ACFXKC_50630 [Streptomyces sp. NPDC059340]|uniref:hypothetical protein n=1 Tax=Streptomyces sp. NPDC059340 TaxID=3346806 RepID=UPI0036CA25B0